MRILTLLFLCIGLKAQAQSLDLVPVPKKIQENRIVFNPLVSTTARTLPQWKFGFQRAGGANINSNILNNALSIGLFDRFEAGVVPSFYFAAPGSVNFMGKVNFYRGQRIDWSATYAENRFQSEVTRNGQVIETPDLVLRSVNIGFNARPEDMPNVTISPFLNTVCGHLDSSSSQTYARSLKCETEWGVDWQYQFEDKKWVTLAYGKLRSSGLSPYEELYSGGGIAWSMLRPNKLISRPSVGVFYTPDTDNALLLISTTFFEK